ncbi:tRNA dihydrouridine synthase [Desulfovibrio litoralis]|uniref:Putative TIM-barrel protein, nifR3 family n=1 Tax=Desulfovibrio litoralis DSM 11393 TaxID=1121455 RepID=A0A1M7TCZ1_9BACT|nr:tRNA-dihydrouridine synthase family protein [Desulfovibrio litoralis]SHN68585.1 putative TIM-barrel protein, nifR3 family [Desulfovibrio litoralis DSM 11393]
MTQPLIITPDKPWLAPLAGYSDLPFRLLCRHYGAAVAVTEMVSAKGLFYNSKASMALLATHPNLPKISAQAKKAWHFPHESVLTGSVLTGSISGGSVLGLENKLNSSEATTTNLTQPINLTHPINVDELQKYNDNPLVVQLFGAEPEYMGRAVATLRELGYSYFDCNMGCSVPKVVKAGAGAALLKEPALALDVAKAMINAASPQTVGFKLRLGWLNGSDTYLDLALALQDAGAGWITLHPRSAKQAFTGKADWTALEKLKKVLTIPLIASGDLLDAQSAVNCVKETGVDSVMFARGAMHAPYIFQDYLQLLKHGTQAEINLDDETQAFKTFILNLVERHVRLVQTFMPAMDSNTASRIALLKMRTFVPKYVRHFSGVKELRSRLIKINSWEELFEILSDKQ